jgi:hypothetical protein
VVIFAVNPFSYNGFRIAKNRSALYRAIKSLGMNYKFDVCAQPLEGEMISFKSIFGRCELDENVSKISKKVYEVFKIPICKLHIQRIEEKAYLCGFQPLKNEELSPEDLKMISEQIFQLSKNGENFVG